MEFLVKNTYILSTLFLSLSCLFASSFARATVVEVRTNLGNFQVNLFDNSTPRTVENFLSYAKAGAYANNTVHRSNDNFVIQMGGFQYASSFPPEPIATDVAVINEPVLSNVRGTLSMAKLGGNPNSATSQFFINLSDNSGQPSNLDSANGGYTVFGQVVGDGIEIVEQISELPTFRFGGAFNELPLRAYTSTDKSNSVEPNDDNLIIITDIVVIDSAVSTFPDLNPKANTLVNTEGQPGSPSSSGGGNMGFLSLVACSVAAIRRRKPCKSAPKL